MDNENSKNITVNVFTIDYCDDVETFIAAVNDSNKSTDVITVRIQNCPSTIAAWKFISNYQIGEVITNKFPSTLFIKLLINGEFEAEKLQLTFWFARKILVSFESTDEIHKIIYWKTEIYGNFIKFHFDTERPSREVKAFVIDFIVNSLKLDRNVKFSRQYDQLIYLTDLRGFNLLMVAIENDNIKILRELLKLPFNINHKTNEDETAADIAWKMENQEILFELLKANSTYPKEFKEDECSEEVKGFLRVSNELHKAIENNNKEEVRTILSENKTLRHFYNILNVSAATAAINNPEIYKILIDNNCSIGPLEDKEELLKLPQKHLQILLINTYFVYNEFDKDRKFNCIRKFFERLDSFPEGQLYLKISATFQPVTNNFDFDSVTPQHMTPNYDISEISEFSFYIAAQKLLDKEKKIEIDEFMLHEFGHFVFKKVFRNAAQPYENSDKKTSAKYSEIVTEIYNLWKRNKTKTEPIVAEIFQHPKFGHSAELIVTIPQMFCHYRKDFKKLTKLRNLYKKIFAYFHDVVMPAMKNSLKIYEKLADRNLKISFAELPETIKIAIKCKIVIFQGQEISLHQITNEEVLKNLSSEKIRQILSTENFKIGKEPVTFCEPYIERKIIDFDYQKEIFNFNYETGELELTKKAIEKSMEINEFHNVFKEIEISNFLLLSDHIDAVKSSTIKQICHKTKEYQNELFVAFIDLKNHFKTLQKFQIEAQKASKGKTIFDFNYEEEQKRIIKTLMKILQLTDDLECSIFENSFRKNQIVLFFVNLDEIQEENFLKFLEIIRRATKIKVCIAARPKAIENIKNDFKLKAFKLLPLAEAQTKEFIEKFSKTEEIDDELKKKIKEICGNLKFLDNPLLHRMIVDLHKAGKLTKDLNRFSFFDEFVELKNQKLDTKIDSKISIWEINQIYAIQTVFSRESLKEHERQQKTSSDLNFDEFELFKQWKIEKPKWTATDIDRCDFLQVTNWNRKNQAFEFIHKTFAEFFATKFIINSVTKAIEAENFDEFKLTMKLAEFLIEEFCKTRKYDEGIFGFIFDYLTLNNFKEIQLGEQFMNYLLSLEVKIFISVMLNEKNWFSRLKIAKIVLSLLKLPQLNDLKFVNNLTVVENGHSKIFQVLFTNRNSAVETVELFQIFKASKLLNWHQMTGYGKNIELLEIDNKIVEIEDHIKTETNFEDKNENEKNILHNQLLWLIANADDIQSKEIHKFLSDFSHHFSFTIIKSYKTMKNFLKIAEKYFHESKEKFAEIAEKFVQGIFLDIENFLTCDQNSQFVKNLNEFFQLLKNFFISEPKFENYLVTKIEKIFQISQPNSSSIKVEENESLNCFQILFIFCEDFNKILRAIEIIKKQYWEKNEIKWLEMTGYFLTQNIDEIESNISNDIYKILHLNIPQLHFEYFYDCHLAKILALAIIYENYFLIERTFELFKKFNFTIKNFQCFLVKISFYINHIKEKRRKIIEKLISILLEIDSEVKKFQKVLLENIENFESFELFAAISFNEKDQLEFYKKRYNSDEILNFFFNNLEHIYFLGNYKPELYRNFYIENFDENFISKPVSECNYFDHNFLQIIYDFLNLISQIDCSLKDDQNFFEKKIFSIFNVMFSSSLFVDKFFEILCKNFNDKKLKSVKWLRDGFGKSNFFNPDDENDKKKVFECQKNVELFFIKCEDFFNSNNLDFSEILIRAIKDQVQISNVRKIHSNHELMKKFLLNDYQNCHPLVIAIYYDIDFLKDFYFKCCDVQEILENLILNIKSISRFYDEELFKKFFTKYFLTDDEKKRIKLRKIMRKIMSGFGKKSIWKNVVETLKVFRYSENSSKNYLKFLKFFFNFVNSLEISIFKFFYLEIHNDDCYEILMSILKDIQITCNENDKNFLRKRNEKFYHHPLLTAIDESFDDELFVYKKIFNSNDFLKIFMKNIHKIVYLNEFNSRNFVEFFIEIFDENFISRSAGRIEKVDDEYSENSYSNDSESEDSSNNQLQIIYDFLCLLPTLDCSLDDLENFFNHKLSFIFNHTFTCYSMMLKIFEIFRKKFSKEKTKVLEWIRKGIDRTEFFNQNNFETLKPNIEKFWAKVENFVNSNYDLMKKILLGDFKKIHPLSIAIRHDIEGVKKLYLKYCNVEEIFQNLKSNLNSIFNYYNWKEEQKLYEKFFNENFPSCKNVKTLFEDLLDEKEAYDEKIYSIANLFEENF